MRAKRTPSMDEEQRKFVETHRVARLATVSGTGNPHVTPVCFALSGESVYITIDRKPKRDASKPLQRLRNIAVNSSVALVVDHFEEDWTQLGWVQLRGEAEVLESGEEHDAAQTLLKSRYPQYREMQLTGLPVIAIRISRVTAWGQLV